MSNFVNLHVHSHYSIDSMIQPEKLVDYIAEIGQEAIALTDHGTLAGIVDMYLACKEKNIKFIPGCEFYLHYHNKPEDNSPQVNHITILSLNDQGFKNLVALNNAAHENTYKRKSGSVPLMTLDMLYNYRHGLHVLTGCPASALFDGDYNFSVTYVNQLCNAVNKENVSVELMFSMSDEMYIQRPIIIAKDLAMPMVVTADAHFLLEKHKAMHPLMVKARKGFDYESSKLYVYTLQDVIPYTKPYLSEKEFNKILDHMQSIVNKVEPIHIESEPVLPINDEAWGILYEKSLELLEQDILKHPEQEDIRRERFEKEISVITNSGFEKYFCLLYDIINFCIVSNIRFNVRGSAAGCYVLYLWGISSLDPIRYGLLFERFLNVHRNDYPDVDCDIESSKRDQVLKYAWEKWGMRGVATFTTYNHKNLVHDLCRVMGIEKDLELAVAEFEDENNEVFQRIANKYPLFEEMYHEVMGQIRHRGKHAGAVCSIQDINVPLEKFDSDTPLIAYSESGSIKTLSKIGGVKLDILGIRKLDQLGLMEKLTGVRPPINPDEYPPEVFDTICSGQLTGMFQISGSQGVRDLTIQIQPRTMEDIGLVSALYRPGALDAFSVEQLVSYKTNPRTLHPIIDELLKDSYSIMIYQENVMDVFAAVTGTGLEGADLARRALTPKTFKVENDPKWVAQKEALHQEFLTKGVERGYDESLLHLLWENINAFVRYGFNKSHAYSYAYLTIQDAWYRTFYPEEYYTALLQSEMQDNGANLQQYIFDAVKAGLKIEMPHINTSGTDFVLKDKKIYLPLNIVSGLGPVALQKILEYRELNGEFQSFAELDKALPPKAVNRTVRAKLYKVNAFEGIDGEPEDFQINPEESDKFTTHEILGFIIPKASVIAEIEKYKMRSDVQIGIVTEIINKNTKNGKPMRRIVLAPEGTFWFLLSDKLFAGTEIKKGMFVRVEVDNFKKAKGMVKYRVN
jgi:DNA polymerase-3 subunit alpha